MWKSKKLHSTVCKVKEIVNKIPTFSGRDHSAVELDVSDPGAVRNLLKTTLDQYSAPPTIIVNSAGITRDNWLLKLSQEDYDSVLNVNLKVSRNTITQIST